MLPESQYIKSEITLRHMSLPEDVLLTKKSQIRWLTLALGLMHPNESRTLLFDVMETLIHFHAKKHGPTTKEILEKIKEITGEEPYDKTVYYHLLKLKDAGVISRKGGAYFLDDGEFKPLSKVIANFYQKKLEESFKPIHTVLDKMEANY